ncbi:MAG: hypothetical protein WBB36_02640 [Chitinophagales bacterium]
MKLTVIIVSVVFLFVSQIMFAQNLVPNNSFETNSGMPLGYGEWSKCTTWNNVNMYPFFVFPYATPDYLHANATVAGVKLPTTTFGTINAHTGNAVMGIALYIASTADFREYLATMLTVPLVIGQLYEISFYVSNGANAYDGTGCNGLAVNFSSSPLTQFNHEHINIIPQCENTTQIWNSGWELLTFYYTATAAYQYITIGNFRSDVATAHTYHGPGNDAAYYFIDDVEVKASIVLPMELLSFSGQRTGIKNRLDWKTASEINSDHFEIEKSEDAKTFYNTGIIKAAGNSLLQSAYTFYDDSNLHAIDFYRLKLVDTDNRCSYSKVIAIESLSQEFSATVLENPFSSRLNISCESNKELFCSYQVCNQLGEIVCNNSQKLFPGSNIITINNADWMDGIYFITLMTGSRIINLRAIKHRVW